MFDLHPWDVGRLTLPEIEAYLQALDEKREEAERMDREAERMRRSAGRS